MNSSGVVRRLASALLAVLLLCGPSLTAVVTSSSVSKGWQAARRRNPPATAQGVAGPSHPHPAVARVAVPERGGISYGSGTLIDVRGDYGLVVTNWHVVRSAAGVILVSLPSGFRSAARAIKIDKDWDLAALIIWRPDIDPVPLATHAPRPGDVMTIAGYGHGSYRSVVGRCTQYVAPGRNHPFEMIEVSVEARQGDSGGPIFNHHGELAGVLFGAGKGTTAGTFCGRVGGFLASLGPDVGRPDVKRPDLDSPDSSTMVAAADTTSRSTPVESAEEIVAAPWKDNPSPKSPILKPVPSNSNRPAVAAVPAGSGPASEDQINVWRDVVGQTAFEQLKTVLAMVGAFALLLGISRSR